MKKNRNTIKGFALGALATVMLFGTGLPAQALSAFQQINVSMGGIKLFIDGQLQVPTDVKGNEVQPLIYAGTTYLPVRALTGMLTDKGVEWDSKTESVYIGTKPGDGEVIRAEQLRTVEGYANALTGTAAQFPVLNETQTPFNRYYIDTGREKYLSLKGMYSELNGEAVVMSGDLGSRNAGKLAIYAVDQYGVKNLIDSYELKAGDEPVRVHTNLRGVDYLYINAEHVELGDFHGSNVAFYNVTFTKVAAG